MHASGYSVNGQDMIFVDKHCLSAWMIQLVSTIYCCYSVQLMDEQSKNVTLGLELPSKQQLYI